jgi:hypothetical protein
MDMAAAQHRMSALLGPSGEHALVGLARSSFAAGLQVTPV